MENLAVVVKEEAREEERLTEAASRFFLTDCVSSMLIRLPIDSLQRSLCVCKTWCSIIRHPVFVQEYGTFSQPVVLFQAAASKVTDFSVEDSLAEPIISSNPQLTKCSIHYMELEGLKSTVRDLNVSCFGRILASCNGLILLENKLKRGGLIVINPVTRKLTCIPPGTLLTQHRFVNIAFLQRHRQRRYCESSSEPIIVSESFGLAFDTSTKLYKVVHLFCDDSGNAGCEIRTVGVDRWWRMVDGPSSKLITYLGHKLVSAMGALHWLPHQYYNDYILSLEMENEQFKTIPLPKRSTPHDRLLETGGSLYFCP